MTEQKRKTIVLIDGHAMIHRAFHALPEGLTNSSGEPVNATFGFTTMLIKALGDIKPDYLAVTFDRPSPTFRHLQYTEYKAHRPTLPDNMRPQFGRIREIVEAFGIPIYEKDGFEADDVLGTLSVQATAQGVDSIILTGDMDTLQLVNEHVRVFAAKRGISEITEYDEAAVEARYGFAPEKLPDFKALVGDTSDNIPGVPGIGEKTASRLIAEYGDLEGVLSHLEELKPREQKLLREGAEQARKSKVLATIVLDAPVQLDLEASRVGKIQRDKLLALFRQLEFRTLVDKIPGGTGEKDTTRAATSDDTKGEHGASVNGSAVILSERSRSPERSEGEGEGAGIGQAQGTVPTGMTARRTRMEAVPRQEEELLFAPPVGVVPIMRPPLPPSQGQEGMGTMVEGADQSAVGTINRPLRTVDEDVKELEGQASDEATQLSLFGEMDSPSEAEAETAHVRKLRLPGIPTNEPLFIEENAALYATNTLVVNSEEALAVLVKSLRDAGRFVLDTESTSEDPWHAELVGISCSMAPGEAYYIPVGHARTVEGEEPAYQLPRTLVLEKLRPVLEDSRISKYMHNAKYDMQLFVRSGIQVRGLAFDTMVAAYLVDPGRRGLGLKDQVFQRLGHVMTPIAQLIGSGSKMISMAQVPIRQAADYAGADADMTLRLVEPMREELRRHGLLDLYYNIELPLVPVLLQMEMYGVALDGEFLRELEQRLGEQIHTLEQAIYDSVGHQFNVNSTKQLGEMLFGELKLPAGKKNKTGYSVSADVIESLRGKHPMVDYLLEYRQLSKLKSTYVDGLLALMDPVSGRVHTSFNQTIASSGRLSSSNPNLQNIPVRTEVGRQIRRAFIADPSYVLLTADYSQFELRILAHITHEPRLVEAFTQNEDIHTITAASLFNVAPTEVTKDQRRLAKTVVYAVLYGQSAFGLSNITGMSNSEASAFIKRYHETFPHIKDYVDSTLRQAYTQGYVNTLYGRKRYFPDMHALPFNERQALEREAMNMPIQGTNADLIKMAMIRIQHAIEEKRMKARMILQVHDELVFEVPVEELDRTKYLVKRLMEGVADLDVPIKVELKAGKNWYEAEPME